MRARKIMKGYRFTFVSLCPIEKIQWDSTLSLDTNASKRGTKNNFFLNVEKKFFFGALQTAKVL